MRHLLTAALATLLIVGVDPPAAAQPVRGDVMPAPRMVVRDARLPVRLESVDVRAEVVGRSVQTEVELVFRNPNDRVLEGELQFPLRDGQWVSGFALDIDGELRPAVPVEKARGQQVFEDVTRARVDPALLEATQGENYRLRVYPLPPQGTRRVVLTIAQTLETAQRGLAPLASLRLPLQFAETLPRLGVELRVANVPAAAIAVRGVAPQPVTREQGADGAARVAMQREQVAGGLGELRFEWPLATGAVVATQTVGAQTWFLAEVPVATQVLRRPAPREVALLWDASGSGAKRDHGREFALLDAWFRARRDVEVSLTIARDVAEPVRRFSVRDGRWDELRRVLDGIAYDGASALSALAPPEGSDLALLFTDGLSNWSDAARPASRVPLYAISAGTSLDAVRLRTLAERSGGEWLDLLRLSTTEAVNALAMRRSRLLGVTSDQARDLVFASAHADHGRITIAGVLTAPQAVLTLEVERVDGNAHGRIERHPVSVTPRVASGQVAQRWAGLRVAELEVGLDDHRAEIRRLGKAFGLVTRETSLIVLDSVADYARHEIEPPPALRPAYERLLAQQGQRRQAMQATHLDGVVRRFAEQAAWWEKTFPKGEMPRPEPEKKRELASAAAGRDGREARADGDLARQRSAAAPAAMAAPDPAPAPPPAPPAAPQAQAGHFAPRPAAKSGPGEATPAATATIQLKRWQPDAPYARRLREAPADAIYRRYLDERPDFVDSTAFFLDAADLLFDRGQPELALRVLSNLAEMDLENRHILRVLGYRLLQAKQPALAIPVFRTVQRLSPDEPQSYRDLGLALNAAGQWQAAADQLWQVVSRPWDARFPDIDMTALAELNAVIAQAAREGRPLRTDAYDSRLLRNLPLDLRITLAWDADNTDIDLWVIDPNGEKAFYGHRLSHQGGRVSRDVTGGYGPEEFALRDAKPGRYTVQAQFYGHRQQVVAPATTVMLRLTTGFGRADQKEELVTLRLAGQRDVVTVGSFEIGR